MARLWKNVPATRGGKYLVLRRDGTIPSWPHFVLGAKDPATPVALVAYSTECRRLGFDPQFVDDTRDLADEFRQFLATYGMGDPDASPHRKDDPAIVAAMDREVPARVETGVVQFGDDWPGVFVRGDNAFAYAMALEKAISSIVDDPIARSYLVSLRGLFAASNVATKPNPQRLILPRVGDK